MRSFMRAFAATPNVAQAWHNMSVASTTTPVDGASCGMSRSQDTRRYRNVTGHRLDLDDCVLLAQRVVQIPHHSDVGRHN